MPVRVRPSAPLVIPRSSEKVQLSLKNQRLQRFLRPESSEVVRLNPDIIGGIIGGILTSIRNVPPNEAQRQTGRDRKAKRQNL